MDQVISIEAFKCPRCKLVSDSRNDVANCLARHLEEERVKDWRQRKIEAEENIRFQVQDIYDLTKALQSHIENFGETKLTLNIKTIKVQKFPRDGWLRPLNISRNDLPKEYDGCKALRVEYSVVFTEECAEFRKYSFREFFIKSSGIHLYIDADRKDGNLNICFDDFPFIKEKYEEYFQIVEEERQYEAKVKSTIAEYERNYYPAKLLSDIEYCALKMDVEDLQRELKEKTLILQARGQVLDDERGVRTYVKPEYNIARLTELKKQFYFGY